MPREYYRAGSRAYRRSNCRSWMPEAPEKATIEAAAPGPFIGCGLPRHPDPAPAPHAPFGPFHTAAS